MADILLGFLRRKTDFFSVDASRAESAVRRALSRQLHAVAREKEAKEAEAQRRARREAERRAVAGAKEAAVEAQRETEEKVRGASAGRRHSMLLFHTSVPASGSRCSSD